MSNFIQRFIDNRVYNVLDQLNLNIDSQESVLFDEEYKMKQNRAFYCYDTPELIRFFKLTRPKNYLYPTNLFYRCVQGSIPILHYPLGQIITKTMVNLLFSENPRFELDTEDNTYTLNGILDENGLGDFLQKACEYESYSGVVAFKPVLDPDFSEYPILIPYPKEDIRVVKKYDRITEVIFRDIYCKDNEKRKYTLYTICGKGYIDYKLYETDNKASNREVPLTTLDETRDLFRIDFYTPDGKQYKKLLCVYKENKAGGRSDYDNLIDDFAALDEIYSNLIDFIRKSRVKTYIPETLLEENVKTGEKVQKNEYDSSDIVLHDSNPEGTTQEVKRDIVDVNNSIMGYKEAFNNVLLNALSTAGLSPASVGLDMAGANSSALALNIRERVSLRTRDEKQKRWTSALKELVELVMLLYTNPINSSVVYVKPYEGDINITWPEYSQPTYDELVNSLSQALNNNLIDLESALKLLYPDKDDAAIEDMIDNINGFLPSEEDIVNRELDNNDEEDSEKE